MTYHSTAIFAYCPAGSRPPLFSALWGLRAEVLFTLFLFQVLSLLGYLLGPLAFNPGFCWRINLWGASQRSWGIALNGAGHWGPLRGETTEEKSKCTFRGIIKRGEKNRGGARLFFFLLSYNWEKREGQERRER